MDIASSRFHQPGLAARLFLLLAFCFMGITQANAAVTAGEWQSASDLSIAQGDRFYDRRLGAYYTYNTVTATSGESLSGELRLVVLSSSHSVLNADGTNADGNPFFMVPADSAEHVVRINFQRRRAAFGYTTQMQRLIERDPDTDGDGIFDAVDSCPDTPQGEAVDANGCSDSQKDDDSDGVTNGADSCLNTPTGEAVDTEGCSESQKDDDNDGVVNSEDACPSDGSNTCFTISGTVRSGGTPLANALVTVGINTVTGTSDANGAFSINAGDSADIGFDGLDEFFPVNAAIDGFATGFAKVLIQPGVFEYELLIDLAPVSDIIGEDEDVTVGVAIDKEDEKVGELTIPADSFPAGVTAITGQITYLDPETDVDLAPGGDLLALPADADPNDTPVPLETFGMMEFDLVDQDGNPVSDLAAPAEVCMKAGAGLAAGDTIPLWYYDDEAGLWIEEGQGTVESRDGQLLICGDVNHFSWWNYDQPINTHSCFKYHFIDGDTGDSLRDVFDWYAEGVTYNGSSPERLCDRDGNDPATPAPGETNIDSLTVKRTTDTNAPEQIRVTTTIGGNKYYLVDDGDGTYSLSTGVSDGAIFDNPVLNASCLNNTNVSDCLFLDYNDGPAANGILPLDIDINLPPAITGFSSDVGQWGDVNAGASTGLFATVTDPEGGSVDIAWSAQCYNTSGNGILAPEFDSGSSGAVFNTQFSAPGVASFYSYCQLTISATDSAGNTANASLWLDIVDPDFVFSVSGVLYGPAGLPMPNHTISFPLGGLCETIDEVVTNSLGEYAVDVPGSCGDGEGLFSEFEIFFDYENINWRYTGYIDPFTCGFFFEEAGIAGEACEYDIYLPTVWGGIQGAVHGTVFANSVMTIELPWAGSGFGEGGGYLVGSPNSLLQPLGYGLLQVPVGGGVTILHSDESGQSHFREFQLLSTEGAVVDIGPALGTVQVTLFDDLGSPLPNTLVYIFANSTNTVQLTTDANGQVSLTDVPLGRVTAWSNTQTFSYGGGHVDTAGQIVEIDLNSPDTCTAEGTTFDRWGQPLAAAEASFTSIEGGFVSSFSDFNGAFTLSGVEASVGYFHLGDNFFFFENEVVIDNCRNNRTIRVDIPERFNFDFYLD